MADGKFHALTTHTGLPCDDIESAVLGLRGSLWLKTSCGVVRVRANQVEAWIANANARVQRQVLDALDGAPRRAVTILSAFSSFE